MNEKDIYKIIDSFRYWLYFELINNINKDKKLIKDITIDDIELIINDLEDILKNKKEL